MSHGSFGESGPLRIAHDAASGVVVRRFAACEFASGGERRLGSAGVSAAGGEQISEVQAARLHVHQNLLGRGMGVGDLLQFENLGTAKTSDDECLHGVSLAGLRRGESSRSPGLASIMKVEFPIPAAWEILWRRGRGLRWN